MTAAKMINHHAIGKNLVKKFFKPLRKNVLTRLNDLKFMNYKLNF